MRVKNKIFILISSFVATILITSIFFILNDFNSLNKQYVLDDLKEKSLNYSKNISNKIEIGVDKLEFLKLTTLNILKYDIDRESILDDLLINILKTDKDMLMLSSWVVFDSKDLTNNLSNKFFYRFDDDIKKIDNIDFKSENFYLLAKERMDSVVTNPYTKTILDKEYFIFTIVTPIVFENIFIGVVGIDYDLRAFKSFINSLDFKDGFLSLISSDFIYATNINSSKIKKNIGYSIEQEEIKRVLKLDRSYIKEGDSSDILNNSYEIYTSIPFHNSTWFLMMSITEDILDFDKQSRTVIFILLLLFIFFIIYIVLNYFINPINHFALEFKKLIESSLKIKTKRESRDDIELLFKNLSHLETILKDRDEKIKELSDLKSLLSKKDLSINHLNFELENRISQRESSLKVALDELSLQKNTLQNSQNTLLTIFNGVYDSIVIHDSFGNIVTVNENFLKLYRIDAKEALTYTISKDYSSDRNNKFLVQDYIQRANSGEIVKFEWIAKRPKDESEFFAEVILRKIHLNNEELILANIRDITEKKEKDLELRILRFSIEKAPIAIYLIDPVTLEFKYVNEIVAKELGYSKDELLIMNILDVDANNNREDLKNLIDKLRSNQVIQVDSKHKRKDKTVFDVDILAVMFEFEEREYICAYIRDITYKKEMELELINQKNFLQQIIDADLNLIFVKDFFGKFVLVNRATSNLFEREKDEIIGKDDIELFGNSKDAQKYINDDLEVLTDKSTKFINEEKIYNSKTDSYNWYQTTKIPLNIDRDLGSRYLLGVSTNITTHKQMQRELKKTNEALLHEQKLFMTGNVIVFEWLNDANWSVEYVSESIEQFGYLRDDLLSGKVKFLDIIYKEDIEHVKNSVNKNSIDGAEFFELDYRVLDSDGNIRWIYDFTRIIRSFNNQVVKYHGYIIDITDRKKIEQDLQASRQKITDSIEYASLIQNSMLADSSILDRYFDEHFLIWEPKDIVGGDIYIIEEFADGVLVSLVDCTGHGVAGAFMTMITKSGFKNILNSRNYNNPARVLKDLNLYLKDVLDTKRGDLGLDASVLFFDKTKKEIVFAGAKIALITVSDKNLKIFKGDRVSLGYKQAKLDFEFTNHVFQVDSEMKFYTTTDGFIDQNGGDKSFPFGNRKLKNLILELNDLNFEKQREFFLKALREYQGFEERSDDISFLGFKISK